jgi:hypothetical protein
MFMDEQTVKDTLDFTEEEVATSKPEAEEKDTAVEETEEQQTDAAKDPDTAEDSEDKTKEQTETEDEDEAFIKSKALDPADPGSLKKMAAMYRNAEKLMGEKSQEAAQYRRMLTEQGLSKPQDGKQEAGTDDPLRREVQTLKNDLMIRDFRERVKPTPEIEAKMSEYLSGPVRLPNGAIASRGQMVMAGMMTLDDVYKLVGGGLVDPMQIKEQVRRQTLAEVANKQKAARSSSMATDQTAFSQPDPYDSFLEGLN